MPECAITSDIIVGFPGESEEDFLDTVDLVERIRFIDAHVFAYSRRHGTPAASYEGQIEESVKKDRSRRLIAVKNEVRDSVLDEIVKLGEPLSVILETYEDGEYTAHSDSFLEVSVAAEDGLQGEMLQVIPVSHSNGVIRAKMV